MLARYFFGSARIEKMSRVPLYRQEEARVILRAQYQAKVELSNKNIAAILPEF